MMEGTTKNEKRDTWMVRGMKERDTERISVEKNRMRGGERMRGWMRG